MIELKHSANPFTCPGCATELCRQAEIVSEADGILLLDVGGFIIRFMSGACKTCGASLHWDVSAQKLTRLLQSVSTPVIHENEL